MDKRLKKSVKIIPLLMDAGLKHHEAAGVATGRRKVSKDEAVLIVTEARRVATLLNAITIKSLTQ